MSDAVVCRTALATPVLENRYVYIYTYILEEETIFLFIKTNYFSLSLAPLNILYHLTPRQLMRFI